MMMPFALPFIIAVTTVICAVWPAARRFAWLGLVLAVINVVLTPFTSGEWSYQRTETPVFERAVARGDFTPVSDLMRHHDPRRLPEMIALALSLLVALAAMSAVQFRAGRGGVSPVISSTVAIAGLLIGVGAVGALIAIYDR